MPGTKETDMKFPQRARGVVKAMAVVLSLALPLVVAVSSADARVGGGFSSGSRGARTFSAPPSTSTAPSTAQPFNRTFTQPGSPGLGAPARGGGFFNTPGRSLLGGLAAGFLGFRSEARAQVLEFGNVSFIVLRYMRNRGPRLPQMFGGFAPYATNGNTLDLAPLGEVRQVRLGELSSARSLRGFRD